LVVRLRLGLGRRTHLEGLQKGCDRGDHSDSNKDEDLAEHQLNLPGVWRPRNGVESYGPPRAYVMCVTDATIAQ
jgi:hypothetical protein